MILELKQNGNVVKTIVYQKNYEEITAGMITYSVHYVYSPDELVAMIVRYDSANVSYEKVYGVVTNHQGSIMALYDTQGKIVWETSYDAWGRERNIAGADYASPVPRPVWLIRGYTGHEHLPEFGLINMNGRLYDPQLARMLSPDNFVQDATSTQGYNRYTYVLNNPLKYKDPSGHIFILDDILVFAGGFVAGYVGYGLITGDWGGKAVVAGLGVGVFAELGYATLGVGSLAAGSFGTAGSFLGNFGSTFGFSMFGAKDQIKTASENRRWDGVLLTVGYGAVASLSSGLSNSKTLPKSKGFLGKTGTGRILGNTAKSFNTLLEKAYDTDTHRWNLSKSDWIDVGLELGVEFASSYTGQLGVNYLSKNENSFLVNNKFMETPIYGAIENVSKNILYLSVNKNNVQKNKYEQEKLLYDLYFVTLKNFSRDIVISDFLYSFK